MDSDLEAFSHNPTDGSFSMYSAFIYPFKSVSNFAIINFVWYKL
jgi:hypothetical protein